MTPKDDFLARLSGETSENIPSFIYQSTNCMELLNLPTSDFFKDDFNGELYGKAVVASMIRSDASATTGTFRTIDIADLGGVMEYVDVPYISKKAFGNPEDFYRHTPQDVMRSVNGSKRCFEYIRKNLPDRGLVLNTGTGLSQAGILRGIEDFFMDLASEPDFAMEEVRFGEELTKLCIDEITPIGIDMVLISGAYDSITFMSFDDLKKYSFDVVHRIIDYCHRKGEYVFYGPFDSKHDDKDMKVIAKYKSMNPDALSLNNGFTLDDMYSLDGKCNAYFFGVDPIDTIYMGSEETIRKDTAECLKSMDDHCVFTYGADRDIPMSKIDCISQAVRSFNNGL